MRPPGAFKRKMSALSYIGKHLFAIVVVAGLSCLTYGAETVPGSTWARPATPEAIGWSAPRLQIADQFARTLKTDAYLVVDQGILVHEFGDTTRPTNVHSVRKSILSLLMGIYADRGAVDLARTLADLEIGDRLGLSQVETQATVRQLMQARSGIYHPAAYETRHMASMRPARASFAPGTHFYYNNWDFNALGTIFRKLTNKTVFEALREEIAVPLQFENFRYDADTRFHYEAASDHPAYVMRLSARDMARVGLLAARNGKWNDRQIVSEKWIAESLVSYSLTDRAGVGYGYLWWIGLDGHHFGVRFPGKVVSARGSQGQYIVVDLARGIVVVHKVNSESERGRSVSAKQFGELLDRIMSAKR